MKRAHLRPLAEADLVQAAKHYAAQGSIQLAERMFDAALVALAPIERIGRTSPPS